MKKQDSAFLGMLLGTLRASLLSNILTAKGVMRAEKGVVSAGTGYNNIDHMGRNLYFLSIL